MGCHGSPVYETKSDRSGGAVAALGLQKKIKRKEIPSMTGVVKVKESKKMPPQRKTGILQGAFFSGCARWAAKSSGCSHRSVRCPYAGPSEPGCCGGGFPGKPDRIYHELVYRLPGGRRRNAYCPVLGKGDKETAKNLFCMINKYVFLISFIFFCAGYVCSRNAYAHLYTG